MRDRTTAGVPAVPAVPDMPPQSSDPLGDEAFARVSVVVSLVRGARPKQWLKNLLVFAAPGAAGVLTDPPYLARSAVGFVAFCLAASGVYFANDVLDAEADRLHPIKRRRPIAARLISPWVAWVAAAALLGCGLAVAFTLGSWKLPAVIGVYAALALSYNLWLKHEPVLDLAAVASGFVLRAIAGGVAAGVAVSQWFLIVASFGSLFMVAGKRHAEHFDLGDERGNHRATLLTYSPTFLRYVRSTTSAVALTAYCLWAFEKAGATTNGEWFQLSIVPFVLAILRYGLLLDVGSGGAPEDLVLRDRTLQALGVLWAVLFAAGVYAT